MAIDNNLRNIGFILLLCIILTQSGLLLYFFKSHPQCTVTPYFNEANTNDRPFVYTSWGSVTNTGSMEPCIHNSTKVYYIENFNLTEGNIYVYKAIGANYTKEVLHRLIGRENDWCYFKGDNNIMLDTRVNCSQVVLQVIALQYN